MNARQNALVHLALKKYYGYDSFRPGQYELIDALMDHRDVLAIMPTGAGKSVCYQIPAVFMDGITLVISPLISLMKDQVFSLLQAGIPAAYLNSSLTSGQYRKALYNASRGDYKIIYAAPERLMTPAFLSFARKVKISMIAVDEAHCVSQWGQNFRPSYLDIAEFAGQLKERPVIAAFTATATGQVKRDMLSMLALKNPVTKITGFDRPNLYFEVQKPKNKDAALLSFLEDHPQESGIIYCLTRKDAEKVSEMLSEKGFPCGCYHGGMSAEERTRNQDDFQYDNVPLIAATSAFGMGINKSNIRFVVHYSMPSSLENYYQEAGRAGRDGEAAHCLLLYSGSDFMMAKFLLEKTNEDNPESLARDLQRLNQMDDYCKTPMCLRSFILQYFGETSLGKCDNCSNCKGDWIEEDISTQAQAVLKAVDSLPRSYGKNLLKGYLKGQKTEKIRSSSLDSLSEYGLLSALSADKIDSLLESLVMQGYLERSDDQYKVISASQKLRQAVKNQEKITMRRKSSAHESLSEKGVIQTRAGKAALSSHGPERELFELLREKRIELSHDRRVPPYVIFSDATLIQMARQMPLDEEELLSISGVGQTRLKSYGSIFLGVIRGFLSDSL